MKIKILLFVFLLTCFLVIFYEYKNCKNEFILFEIMNNHLTYRLNLTNREQALQIKMIGKKINMPQNISSLIRTNTILIVENDLANKKSFNDAVKFSQNLFTKNYNVDVNILAVVPTKNIGYLKAISQDFSNKISFVADTNFFFRKEMNIQDSENAVILIDNSEICLYTYVLEIDNPLNNKSKAEIILNILKSR